MGKWQDEAFFKAREAGTVPWHEPRFADLLATGEWAGEDVWIIGGGPSVKGCDLAAIEGRKTLAVNMGFTVCAPTLVFIGSVLLLQRLCAGRAAPDINCPVVTHERAVWNTPTSYGCHVLEVADEVAYWGKSVREGVPAFSNSGLMAVNLADILGARRIYLIGFDMTGGKDGKTINFHNEYPEGMRPEAGHYDTYLADFRRVPKHCRAEVWNCSPNSRLDLFEHMPFEETLR